VGAGGALRHSSIRAGIDQTRAADCERVLVVPCWYPQYAATTTATVVDAVTPYAARLRDQPELRCVKRFHEECFGKDPRKDATVGLQTPQSRLIYHRCFIRWRTVAAFPACTPLHARGARCTHAAALVPAPCSSVAGPA